MLPLLIQRYIIDLCWELTWCGVRVYSQKERNVLTLVGREWFNQCLLISNTYRKTYDLYTDDYKVIMKHMMNPWCIIQTMSIFTINKPAKSNSTITNLANLLSKSNLSRFFKFLKRIKKDNQLINNNNNNKKNEKELKFIKQLLFNINSISLLETHLSEWDDGERDIVISIINIILDLKEIWNNNNNNNNGNNNIENQQIKRIMSNVYRPTSMIMLELMVERVLESSMVDLAHIFFPTGVKGLDVLLGAQRAIDKVQLLTYHAAVEVPLNAIGNKDSVTCIRVAGRRQPDFNQLIQFSNLTTFRYELLASPLSVLDPPTASPWPDLTKALLQIPTLTELSIQCHSTTSGVNIIDDFKQLFQAPNITKWAFNTGLSHPLEFHDSLESLTVLNIPLNMYGTPGVGVQTSNLTNVIPPPSPPPTPSPTPTISLAPPPPPLVHVKELEIFCRSRSNIDKLMDYLSSNPIITRLTLNYYPQSRVHDDPINFSPIYQTIYRLKSHLYYIKFSSVQSKFINSATTCPFIKLLDDSYKTTITTSSVICVRNYE